MIIIKKNNSKYVCTTKQPNSHIISDSRICHGRNPRRLSTAPNFNTRSGSGKPYFSGQTKKHTNFRSCSPNSSFLPYNNWLDEMTLLMLNEYSVLGSLCSWTLLCWQGTYYTLWSRFQRHSVVMWLPYPRTLFFKVVLVCGHWELKAHNGIDRVE